MQKHQPKARKLCIECFNDKHDRHTKRRDTIGHIINIKLPNKFRKFPCECPICNNCPCEWCKDMRKLYGIGEGR